MSARAVIARQQFLKVRFDHDARAQVGLKLDKLIAEPVALADDRMHEVLGGLPLNRHIVLKTGEGIVPRRQSTALDEEPLRRQRVRLLLSRVDYDTDFLGHLKRCERVVDRIAEVRDDNAPIEIDVLVLALGTLGDLQSHVQEIAESCRKFGQLINVHSARVQVGLKPLEVFFGSKHAVAPQKPTGILRTENLERPLEHRVACGLRLGKLYLVDLYLILAIRHILELTLFDFRFRKVVIELSKIDIAYAGGVIVTTHLAASFVGFFASVPALYASTNLP